VSDADLFEIGVSQNGPLWAPNDMDGQAQGGVRGSEPVKRPSVAEYSHNPYNSCLSVVRFRCRV